MEIPAIDATAPTAPMTSADCLYSSTMDKGLTMGLTHLTDAAIAASNDASADLFAFPSATPSVMGLGPTVTRSSHSLQRSPPAAQVCSCLVQALGLVKRLSELLCSTIAAGHTKTSSSCTGEYQCGNAVNRRFAVFPALRFLAVIMDYGCRTEREFSRWTRAWTLKHHWRFFRRFV